MNQVENNVNNVTENVSNQISKITSISFKDFINSNSMISKIAFALLVMFIFFVLLKFSINFIPQLLKKQNSPRIIDGTIDGNHGIVVPQDPKFDNAVTIKRSVNERGGIEFSWSLWCFLDDSAISSTNTKDIHIFHKGDHAIESDPTLNQNIYKNATPGLYLKSDTNALKVVMNVFASPSASNEQQEIIDIGDIPMNKWFNIIIRVKNKRVDTYINGTIKSAIELNGIPKQNYGNIFIAQNDGGHSLQSSKLSNLWYFNHALNVYEIQNLVQTGPNKKLITSSAVSDTSVSYLAFDWFYRN